MTDITKLGTESYKGVRDFYPEDNFVQNHIFDTWKKVVKSFGYEEYNASILESAELYKAKSGEEIVNEQTYTFMDRGEREVTLRPEMTPTVARLVAAKVKELSFPLRWFSIPNLFRYEKPQKGRLREHWQLNVDLFGVDSILADMEILEVAYGILKEFGATDDMFVIRINDRRLMNALYEKFSLDKDASQKISKIIDKKDKLPADNFSSYLSEIMGEKAEKFEKLLNSNEELLEFIGPKNEAVVHITSLIEKLQKRNIKNVVFDPTLMRGFDYYTGMVFEVFDVSPDNNRSVYGGGRYDDLLDIFGAPKIPAVGFGAGDVTLRDFLEIHNLLPVHKSTTQIHICILGETLDSAQELAQKLREIGVNVSLDLSGKKLGDQIKLADKKKIPFTLVVGDDEIKSGVYPLKNLLTGEEKKVKFEEIKEIVS